MIGAAPAALSPQEFAVRLDALGPFEDRPDIAVAASGGPDSMALLLLAAGWARARGGSVTALTVDHGLRPDSAGEARRVAGWCAARGIEHRILPWTGPKPDTGLQQAARAARYELLATWCRLRAIAHLLVGHHAGDQAETFLHRMSRGSGVDGLAAMPAAGARDGVRLLRPLLDCPPARLAAVLADAGQDWIEDPSNRDRRFARVVLREKAASLDAAGIGPAATTAAIRALGRLRAERDIARAALAARVVAVYPEGYAEVDPAALQAVDADLAASVLSALLHAVGGREFAPRRARVETLAGAVRSGGLARPRTLGGCIVAPSAGRLRVVREPRAVAGAVSVGGLREIRWDGRFDIGFSGEIPLKSEGYAVGPLGAPGWQAVAGKAANEAPRLPGPVLFALPALWRAGNVDEVPHLGYVSGRGTARIGYARFRPGMPFAGTPFRVA